MYTVDPSHFLGRFDRRDLQIDDDRFLSASNQHTFERLIDAGVDLLVRNIRRNIDKVAGAGFGGELEMIAPTHPGPAFDDVDDAFKPAVMMRSGLGVWIYAHRARPQFARASSRLSYSGGAIHTRRLSRVRVEFIGVNDANSVMFPIRLIVRHIGILCQQ